jgi:hypothetical protein
VKSSKEVHASHGPIDDGSSPSLTSSKCSRSKSSSKVVWKQIHRTEGYLLGQKKSSPPPPVIGSTPISLPSHWRASPAAHKSAHSLTYDATNTQEEEDNTKIQSSGRPPWRKKHGQDRHIPVSSRESRAASPALPPAIRQSPKSKSHAQPARGKLHPSSYL